MNDSIKNAIEDNSEFVIDKFAKTFLSSDLGDAIGDFPILSTGKGIASGIYSLVNWRISRNIAYFVQALQCNKIAKDEYDQLSKKYGRAKILENVLLSLESMRSEKQADAFAYLFEALVKGKIDWDRYSQLQNILEKIDPFALDEDFNGRQPSYRLVVVGLAYIQTVYDSVKVVPNGKLYADFVNYIITPYRSKQS